MPALRTTVRLLGASTFVALVACGGGEPSPQVDTDEPSRATPLLDPTLTVSGAAELGACPPELQQNAEDGSLDFTPLRSRLHADDVTWWKAQRIERPAGTTSTTSPQDRSVPVALVGAAGLASDTTAPTSARLYGPNWPQVALANEAGHSFYLGRRAGGLLESVVAVDGDGRIGFVGQCEVIMSTETMQAFVGAVRAGSTSVGLPADATAEAVLAAVVQRGTPAAAAFASWGGAKPLSWLETPADRRSIDPDDTPADIMATLRKLPFAIAVPVEWRGRDDVTFCTRTAFAWGECTALDAGPAGEPVRLVAYVRAGEGFEVWALDGQAAFDAPIARLAAVAASTVDQRLAGDAPLRLQPPGSGSLDDVLGRAKAGGPALVEAP